MEYFVRDFRSEVIEGPFTYTQADRYARDFSSTNESGLAEMIVYQSEQILEVGTYLRGNKRYQGWKSIQAARDNLPPTV